MNYKDLTGQKIGMLTVLKRERKTFDNKKARTYYYCECDCGNFSWIRGDALTKKNPTISCGCLSKEKYYKSMDIKNKRFGRLIAINDTGKVKQYNNAHIWLCKCDCGNFKEVSIAELNKGVIRSCGCLSKEIHSNNGKIVMNNLVRKNIIDKTNIPAISKDKLLSTNTSGYTGVSYSTKNKLWVATIQFKNKIYYLGSYKDKEDAIKARKQGEKEYHLKFLETLNKE